MDAMGSVKHNDFTSITRGALFSDTHRTFCAFLLLMSVPQRAKSSTNSAAKLAARKKRTLMIDDRLKDVH